MDFIPLDGLFTTHKRAYFEVILPLWRQRNRSVPRVSESPARKVASPPVPIEERAKSGPAVRRGGKSCHRKIHPHRKRSSL